MSGFGIGEELFGLMFSAAEVTSYATREAILGTARLTIEAGRAAHRAYVRHEERRREELRQKLELLNSEIGREALTRHDAIVAASRAAAETTEASRASILSEFEASERRLAETSISTEEAVSGLSELLGAHEAMLQDVLQQSAEAFSTEIARNTRDIFSAIQSEADAKARTLRAGIDSAAEALIEKNRRNEAYSRATLADCNALLDVLEESYDCQALAGGEYMAVQTQKRMTEERLRSGSWAEAAMAAGMYRGQVQLLHATLERNESRYQHMKQELEALAQTLEGMVQATHDMKSGSDLADLEYYVDEAFDANFWSDGRLSGLWAEAGACIDAARQFDCAQMPMARTMLLQANRVREGLLREYARARQHVASRFAMDELLAHANDCMNRLGWQNDDEPVYVALDPVTGQYVESGDPRGSLMVRYHNSAGDERTIIIQNHYDAAAGRYMQRIARLCNEVDTPDEAVRAADDAAFNAELEAAAHIPASARIRCDRRTMGAKAR